MSDEPHYPYDMNDPYDLRQHQEPAVPTDPHPHDRTSYRVTRTNEAGDKFTHWFDTAQQALDFTHTSPDTCEVTEVRERVVPT